MKAIQINRRNFLRGTGASLALPWLEATHLAGKSRIKYTYTNGLRVLSLGSVYQSQILNLAIGIGFPTVKERTSP